MFKFLVAHKEDGDETEIIVAMFRIREDAEIFLDAIRIEFPEYNWYIK